MSKFYFPFIFLLFSFKSKCQSYSMGEKAEGGIVFNSSKKHGSVVAEKVLGQMTWDLGKVACDSLVLNGYDNWRLPSRTEISVIYYELVFKKIINFPAGFYWTKSENKGIRTLAWFFDFLEGNESNTHTKSNEHYILAVRDY